jgi:aerobic-type carbon monoxide dehydrogenase small subunit (CoxS/CutS family)
MTRHVLTVNDRERAVDVAPGASLLDVLRDGLGLFGAKYGCGEGRCGACCVLVDGRSVPSCDVRVEDVGARAIVTAEGLAPGPVQDAFVAENAMQCGYCTSGMVIAATALLASDPAPTDAAIVDALDGHLCRCGVYGRVVCAVRRAAAGGR